MVKIGIVDYFIDEWHSNTYLGLFDEAFKEMNLDYQISYGWAEMDRFENRLSTKEWCDKNNITVCDTIEELCEKSDRILILAPANPETHLRFVEKVFPFGKPTYVDKTFASDYATAKKIIELSKKYNTPFFTTSALRYASEINEFIGTKKVSIDGGGRLLDEYVIHQLEMLVKTIGTGAEKLRLTNTEKETVIEIAYPDERSATLHYNADYPFIYRGEKNGEMVEVEPASDYFKVLICKILTFFETGEVDFKMEETAEVMKLREKVITAKETPNTWLEVDFAK